MQTLRVERRRHWICLRLRLLLMLRLRMSLLCLWLRLLLCLAATSGRLRLLLRLRRLLCMRLRLWLLLRLRGLLCLRLLLRLRGLLCLRLRLQLCLRMSDSRYGYSGGTVCPREVNSACVHLKSLHKNTQGDVKERHGHRRAATQSYNTRSHEHHNSHLERRIRDEECEHPVERVQHPSDQSPHPIDTRPDDVHLPEEHSIPMGQDELQRV